MKTNQLMNNKTKQSAKAPQTKSGLNTVIENFKGLSFDAKVEVFKALKDEMAQSFEIEFKASEERCMFLKDAFGHLIKCQN